MKRILFLLPLLAVATGVIAQPRLSTPRNHGMGGGGTAYMTGHSANFINPANLMLNRHRNTRLSIGLSGFSTAAGGPLLDISTYNKYLTTGATITAPIADEMLGAWFGNDPNASSTAAFGVEVTPLGVSWRGDSWAASVAYRFRTATSMEASRGTGDLFFRGLDPEVFGDGRAVDFGTETAVFSEISLGYARQVWGTDQLFFGRNVKVYAGVAPKFLLGHTLQQVDFRSTLTVREGSSSDLGSLQHDYAYTINTLGSIAEGMQSFYEDRVATGEYPEFGDYIEPEAGDFAGVNSTGFGLDLGATLEMDISNHFLPDFFLFNGFRKGDSKLFVSASLTDLGSLKFTDGIGSFAAQGTVLYEGFIHDPERVDAEFGGDQDEYLDSFLNDSLGVEKYQDFVPQDLSEMTYGLPGTFNLGTYLALGRFGLALDLGTGFNNRGMNAKRMVVAMGTEYRFFGVWPVRAGFRKGGFGSTTWHAGTGLEFRNVDFTLSVGGTAKGAAEGAGLSAAFSGISLRF